MDGKRCLCLAAESIRCNDHDGVLEYLGKYRDWRKRGGFEPVLHDHELDGAMLASEGGIQGDRVAQHLRIEAQCMQMEGVNYSK